MGKRLDDLFYLYSAISMKQQSAGKHVDCW
jgi:hypothetical protein